MYFRMKVWCELPYNSSVFTLNELLLFCPDDESPKVKLECIATYPLHDNVASMAAVSLNPRRDSLMLGFRDARLSVVEYDHHTHDLKTISLHYFETQELKVWIITYSTLDLRYLLRLLLIIWYLIHKTLYSAFPRAVSMLIMRCRSCAWIPIHDAPRCLSSHARLWCFPSGET